VRTGCLSFVTYSAKLEIATVKHWALRHDLRCLLTNIVRGGPEKYRLVRHNDLSYNKNILLEPIKRDYVCEVSGTLTCLGFSVHDCDIKL